MTTPPLHSTSSWLATWLDVDLLISRGATISRPLRTGSTLPPSRPGFEIAVELGERKLIRFLLPDQVGQFRAGTTRQTFVTPTPYAPHEAGAWLMLPSGEIPRPYDLIWTPRGYP